jgi:integrase
MSKHNSENEIIKHRYFQDMEKGDGYSTKTIDSARNAINRYEAFTNHECFKKSNIKTFAAFKSHLLTCKNAKGGQLSLSTIEHTVTPLQRFFRWLSKQNGYKKSLNAADARYLGLKKEDRRKIHTVPKFKEYYTIEEIKLALNFNPKSDVEMRDRAIIATLACTAMRHEAMITAKVGHFDLKRGVIIQDPNTMRTKNSKFINTTLIPLDDGVKQIAIDWVRYLKEELHFTDNDPLFPKEAVQHDEYNQFIGGVALSRNHIESHEPITRIIKRVFERVGLKYNNPHTFRDMQTHHIMRNGDIEQLAALSLNLGHENVAITIGNYYQPTPEQQFDILSKAGKPKKSEADDNILLEYVRMQMQKENLGNKQSL